MTSMADLDFSNADSSADADDLDALRVEIVQCLRSDGPRGAAAG